MAFSGNSKSNSGMAEQNSTGELQGRSLTMVPVSNLPAMVALMIGTGFESLPPLAITYKPFQFLKSVGLKNVGLGLDCVPFHLGWKLVEWNPNSTGLWDDILGIVDMCDKRGEEGPENFSIDLREPLMEEFGEPSMEGMTGEEPRTGAEPVLDIEMVETGTEPVSEIERTTGCACS